jgi:twitching motility protein PilT
LPASLSTVTEEGFLITRAIRRQVELSDTGRAASLDRCRKLRIADHFLIDALREDPDVLMVGEMREPQTMQLTLTASETGHQVLATMHSATCAEALQRLTSAFPSDIQNSVRAQLADCLVAVICQRLRYRGDLKIRVPELEVLIPTIPVKNYIRNGDFFKIAQIMEVGAEQGMWTWARYQTWMEKKKEWHIPDASDTIGW